MIPVHVITQAYLSSKNIFWQFWQYWKGLCSFLKNRINEVTYLLQNGIKPFLVFWLGHFSFRFFPWKFLNMTHGKTGLIGCDTLLNNQIKRYKKTMHGNTVIHVLQYKTVYLKIKFSGERERTSHRSWTTRDFSCRPRESPRFPSISWIYHTAMMPSAI